MARANLTSKPVALASLKTTDSKLFALYADFSRQHAKLVKLDTPLAMSGAGAAGKRAHKKWAAQVNVVDQAVKKMLAVRASSVEGMLLKIQVTGFSIDWAGRSWRHPSEGAMWQPHSIGGYPLIAEKLLIISVRSDLARLNNTGSRA